jgi:hypothetical protein
LIAGKHSGTRREAFIKLCDIRDSKEDSLETRVFVFIVDNETIFQKITNRSKGTIISPCQIHGIPSEQEKEEG